jgi:hypothetical protein
MHEEKSTTSKPSRSKRSLSAGSSFSRTISAVSPSPSTSVSSAETETASEVTA